MGEFIVVRGERRVDAWTNRRLPFEPTGSALELRSQLRQHIGALQPRGLLRCTYGSADATFCDTENVLLYNVGMSTFTGLVEAGLVFERRFDVPPSPTGDAFAHHHSYATSDSAAFESWATPQVVSRWKAQVPRKRSSAAAWWIEVSSASPTIARQLKGEPFGVRVRVAPASLAIQSTLKAMLDGTIAALHSNPMPSPVAVDRLAEQLGRSAPELISIFRNDAPLGERPDLVRPYRDGVQWNPADDLCVACSVVVDSRLPSGVVAGELVEVAPL